MLEYRRYFSRAHLFNGNLPCLGDVLRTLVKNYRDGQKILICVIEKSPRVMLKCKPVKLMQHTDAPETEAYRLEVGERFSQYALILFSYVIFLCHNSKSYETFLIQDFKHSNIPIEKIILRKSFSVLLNQAHIHRISLVTEFPYPCAKTEATEKIERVKWRQAVAVKQITQDAFLLRVCCVLFHNSKVK